MDTTSIGTLFGNIPAKINSVLGPLQQPVSAAPFSKDASLDSGDKPLQVFGTPITLGASLTAKVATAAANAVPGDPFGDGSLAPVANNTYTSLTIDGEIHGSGSGSGQQGVLKFSLDASAKASFSYAHYLPVPNKTNNQDTTLLSAFTSLATSTTLPQLANLKSLAPGEVLDLSAAFGVDFNLKATYGAEANIAGTFDLLAQLSEDLALPFTAHVALAVSAAFGFSLADTFRYTVARAGLAHDPNWVRIRLAREHQNRISFALAINLSIDYDATSGAQMLLDKAFALIPTSSTIDTLKEISALPANWDEFKQQITDEAAKVVGRLVDDTGWKELVAASPEIQQLVAGANKVVTLYNGIDAKVQSIIEELIAKLDDAGLTKLRPIIDKVAALDVDNIDLKSLLTESQQDVVHWIEVLSGRSIEELVITGKVKEALTRAKTLAAKIQPFLTGDAESKAAIAAINSVLQKSGAAGLVAWLQKNATSVQALQAAGDKAVGDVVRRLVGKGLDQISPADVARIQKLAADLNKILNAPQVLHDKLQNGIKKLKGSIGFNVSIELSRVSEHSAVVDIEIDPSNAGVVAAVKNNLTSGDVGHFLSDLSHIKPNNGDAPEYPYFIREVILKSSHVRTSARSTVVAFLGFSLATQESSIAESSVTVTGGGTAASSREATYSGGASITRADGSVTAVGAAFIRVDAKGPGTDVNAAYDDVTPVLSLTYSRQDSKTTKSDVESLRTLLLDFGLTQPVMSVTLESLAGKQTNFAMAIELPQAAVTALIQQDANERLWQNDALNAAHRWFSDPDRVSGLEAQTGREMASVVVNAAFRDHWTDFMGPDTPGDKFLKVRDQLGINLFKIAPGKGVNPDYGAVRDLLGRRAFASNGFTNYDANPGSSTPDDLAKATHASARLFTTLQTQWQPPLFNFWLVLARLLRIDESLVTSGRGLITLRSRADSNGDWVPVMDPVVLTEINPTPLKNNWFVNT
jgi:hypothetical protein